MIRTLNVQITSDRILVLAIMVTEVRKDYTLLKLQKYIDKSFMRF